MHEGTIWITDTYFGELRRSLSAFNAPDAALTSVIPAASALISSCVWCSGEWRSVLARGITGSTEQCCIHLLFASENIQSDF